jgi:adenylate cyclase
VQAALEIQKALKEWGRVDAGIGIHTGEAIVGNIGSKHKVDYTAIGRTVNIASRLEGETNAGDIVISKDVYDKVKHRFQTKHKETVTLKGMEKPVETYRYKTKTENYRI